MLKKDELTLIKYIKDSIETLIQVLAEEKINEYSDKRENKPQEYETLLIKSKKVNSFLKISPSNKIKAA